MDPNWIMAIIAISAIFSPAIVSIIDNICKYKSKQLELKYPNQRKVLSNFVNLAMNTYNANNFKEVVEYNIVKNDLYIYFNNVPDKLIKDLETYNEKHLLSNYKNTINQIIKELSQQIDK